MIARIILLLALVPATTSFAQTGASCPWFTAGSAAKVLGGDVTTVVRTTGNWEGSCLFTRASVSVKQEIDILVGKADTHPCPERSNKVIALGNEAVQCERMESPTQSEATIAGRIRDVYFVVSMVNVPAATREPSLNAKPPDRFGGSLLERTAEEVVGNLY
jgi:hypothetical protein